MFIDSNFEQRYLQIQLRVLAARCARVMRVVSRQSEGAGNAGCALHPRSRVQKVKQKRTRAYRFSGSNPTFPAQWLYGLCPALPGERIRLVAVAAGLIADRIRSDRFRHRQLGTSNGCRDHRVLPYATTPFVLRAVARSRKTALRTHHTPDAAASTASHPAFVTIAIRPSSRVRRASL